MFVSRNLLNTRQKLSGGPWFCGMILLPTFGFASKILVIVPIQSMSIVTYLRK